MDAPAIQLARAEQQRVQAGRIRAADRLHATGQQLVAQSELQSAAIQMTAAIFLYPGNNSSYFSSRGDVFARIGFRDKAAEDFRRAIALDNNSLDGHVGLARILERQNKFQESLEELRTARLKARALSSIVHSNVAISYLNEEIDRLQRRIDFLAQLALEQAERRRARNPLDTDNFPPIPDDDMAAIPDPGAQVPPNETQPAHVPLPTKTFEQLAESIQRAATTQHPEEFINLLSGNHGQPKFDVIYDQPAAATDEKEYPQTESLDLDGLCIVCRTPGMCLRLFKKVGFETLDSGITLSPHTNKSLFRTKYYFHDPNDARRPDEDVDPAEPENRLRLLNSVPHIIIRPNRTGESGASVMIGLLFTYFHPTDSEGNFNRMHKECLLAHRKANLHAFNKVNGLHETLDSWSRSDRRDYKVHLTQFADFDRYYNDYLDQIAQQDVDRVDNRDNPISSYSPLAYMGTKHIRMFVIRQHGMRESFISWQNAYAVSQQPDAEKRVENEVNRAARDWVAETLRDFDLKSHGGSVQLQLGGQASRPEHFFLPDRDALERQASSPRPWRGGPHPNDSELVQRSRRWLLRNRTGVAQYFNSVIAPGTAAMQQIGPMSYQHEYLCETNSAVKTAYSVSVSLYPSARPITPPLTRSEVISMLLYRTSTPTQRRLFCAANPLLESNCSNSNSSFTDSNNRCPLSETGV